MIRFLAEFPDVRNNGIPHIESPIMLEAARSFNTVGSATLIIPDFIDRRSLRKNTRMKLWRRGLDGTTRLFGDTHWFLRKIKHSYSTQTYTLEFSDALLLLSFRLVAYTSQTPYADKTLEEFELVLPDNSLRIDNMMRAYVRENYSTLALDTDRINTRITVEEDRNLAPHGDQSAAWRLLSDTLNGLANMSAEKGTELFYDLVPQPDDTFIFKVWDKVRGRDRGSDSDSILTLSEELNHLTEVEEIEDYNDTATYAYVLGYDSGPSQIISEVENSIEIANDPFGRVEFTVEAKEVEVDRVLQNIGQAALNGKRPRRTVSARAVEGTGIVYGRDYNYGDRVMIMVGKRKYNCHVRAVRSRWENAQEDLEVRLEGYDEDAYPTLPNIPDEAENQAPIVDAGPDQEIGEEEEGAPSFGLVSTQELVVGVGSLMYLCRTSNFTDASPTWDKVEIDFGVETPPTSFNSFVVDPFSPGYILGTGAINGFAVSRNGIWKINDMFSVTPTATLLHTNDPANLGSSSCFRRRIAASFGRYQVDEADNPWLMVVGVFNASGATPNANDGLWEIHSTDGGQTWSTEQKVTAFAISTATRDINQEPSIWLSPRTPGLAITFAYDSNTTTSGFVSTDWGATWTECTDPLIQNSAGYGGSIHVPWQDNDDEQIVYHGHYTHGTPGIWKLKRVTGTTIEDVTPTYLGDEYGPTTNLFGLRAHDNNRQYMLMGGGADLNPSGLQDELALFVSTDAGDTWSMVVHTNNTDDLGDGLGWQAAFTADDVNSFYVWGGSPWVDAMAIGFSDDTGATVDDKSGNLYTMADSDPDLNGFIGIAGGPTA